MGTVTKIKASYSQKVAPQGTYDNKEATAEIEVAFDDLADLKVDSIGIELDEAMGQAKSVVRQHLGIESAPEKKSNTSPPSTASNGGKSSDTRPVKMEEIPEEDLTPGQRSARTRARNKLKKAAEEAAAAAANADPMADVMGDTSAPAEPEVEFNMDEDLSDPAEEILDGDLQTAINLRLKRFKDDNDPDGVEKVKAAIRAFAPDDGPFTVKQLPQGSRRKFLNKLDAME
jgi:hypothetical protein